MEHLPRKRRRPAVACVECRRRKVKCDRARPCGPCRQSVLICIYRPPSQSHAPPDQTLSLHNCFHNSNFMSFGNMALDQIISPPRSVFLDDGSQPISTKSKQTSPVNKELHTTPSILKTGDLALTPFLSSAVLRDESPLLMCSRPRVSSAMAGGLRPGYLKTTINNLDRMGLFSSHVSEKSPAFHEEVVEVQNTLDKCREYANNIQTIRSCRRMRPIPLSDGPNKLPLRSTCDLLVRHYLRTFESVLRILHIPSFEEEYESYWNNPWAATEVFLRKLMLVLAIGTCFAGNDDEYDPQLRSLGSIWTYDTQAWLMRSFDLFGVDFHVLQVSCLLMIARKTDLVSSQLDWISADFPLRMAIRLELHKEPSIHFPNMPLFEAEKRKRLWATVLELSLQSALDSGMPLLVTYDDYDCQPPGNFDDTELLESLGTEVMARPINILTQSSISIMLMKTIKLRMRIVQSLSSLEPEIGYHEALKLSSELEAACRLDDKLIQSYNSRSSSNRPSPTGFQQKLLGSLTRRCLLAIHGNFAIRAKSDPSFYFSHKAATETSLLLLRYLLPKPESDRAKRDDDYACLMVSASSMFSNILWEATAHVCTDLVSDITENQFPLINSLSRSELIQAIQSSIDISKRRIRAGDTVIEPYVLFSCSLAHIRSAQDGKIVERSILDAAKNSLLFCYKILENQVREVYQHGQPELSTNHLSEHLQGDYDNGADLWDMATEIPIALFD